MITSKQIYLIVTEGCESCKIMERILKQVCKDNNYTFSIQIATYESVPDFFGQPHINPHLQIHVFYFHFHHK